MKWVFCSYSCIWERKNKNYEMFREIKKKSSNATTADFFGAVHFRVSARTWRIVASSFITRLRYSAAACQ